MELGFNQKMDYLCENYKELDSLSENKKESLINFIEQNSS